MARAALGLDRVNVDFVAMIKQWHADETVVAVDVSERSTWQLSFWSHEATPALPTEFLGSDLMLLTFAVSAAIDAEAWPQVLHLLSLVANVLAHASEVKEHALLGPLQEMAHRLIPGPDQPLDTACTLALIQVLGVLAERFGMVTAREMRDLQVGLLQSLVPCLAGIIPMIEGACSDETLQALLDQADQAGRLYEQNIVLIRLSTARVVIMAITARRLVVLLPMDLEETRLVEGEVVCRGPGGETVTVHFDERNEDQVMWGE